MRVQPEGKHCDAQRGDHGSEGRASRDALKYSGRVFQEIRRSMFSVSAKYVAHC